MIAKLLNFPKKKQTNEIAIDLVIAQIELGPDKEANLVKLLTSLREKEQAMKKPLLKDWINVRNDIRQVEKKIRSYYYERL